MRHAHADRGIDRYRVVHTNRKPDADRYRDSDSDAHGSIYLYGIVHGYRNRDPHYHSHPDGDPHMSLGTAAAHMPGRRSHRLR
jgi:hypothetical protein